MLYLEKAGLARQKSSTSRGELGYFEHFETFNAARLDLSTVQRDPYPKLRLNI